VASPIAETRSPDDYVQQLEGTKVGTEVEVVCPVCNGVLTESQPGVFEHFRCHVGHTFSLQSLVSEQGEQLERALWAAIRALEESAALAERLSYTERGELKKRFAEKARSQRAEAELLRRVVIHGEPLSPEDAAKLLR
jgi:two-component system chemotaxis response regulator CheB